MFSELLNPPLIISMLIALSVHEWAHAFVADRLGDPTPRSEGRLTLNPAAHLDPLGTLMLFLIHFGWGKPVPINPRYFRHIKRDTALVAVAGPLSNLILAIVCFVLLSFLAPQVMHVGSATELLASHGIGARLQAFFFQILATSLFMNLGLMAFNLLPIAPLDGSKILAIFIGPRHEDLYERFLERGPIILITLLVLERLFNVPLLILWISTIMDASFQAMMFIFGA